MTTTDQKTLVLLSGGLDSMTLATREKKSGTLRMAVFVDWGQPAEQAERAVCTRFMSESGIEIPRKSRGAFVSLATPLRGAPSIGLREFGAVGPMVIPVRNAVLLSLACNIAEVNGIRRVLYAANADDAKEYPDCRSEFVDAFNDVLRTSALDVRIEAPFIGMTKRTIWKLSRELRVGRVCSCYTPIYTPVRRASVDTTGSSKTGSARFHAEQAAEAGDESRIPGTPGRSGPVTWKHCGQCASCLALLAAKENS